MAFDAGGVPAAARGIDGRGTGRKARKGERGEAHQACGGPLEDVSPADRETGVESTSSVDAGIRLVLKGECRRADGPIYESERHQHAPEAGAGQRVREGTGHVRGRSVPPGDGDGRGRDGW